MIALIVCGLIIVLTIIIVIISYKKYDTSLAPIFGITAIMLIIISVSHIAGYKTYNRAQMKYKKEQYEILLTEGHLSKELFDEIEVHNSNIDFGNNLWSRFNIEDREEYKIDINEYLNKFKENRTYEETDNPE